MNLASKKFGQRPLRSALQAACALLTVAAASTPAWGQCAHELAKLTATDGSADDSFGISLAISGDTVLVGANDDDVAGSSSGSAYVFVRAGTAWTQQAKLTASDVAAHDLFGNSVALSDDTAVVGAVFATHAGGVLAGSAYVFTRTGGVWTEQQKLTASDAAQADVFGWSVAVSGDTALVGTYGDDDAGEASGSAYVFTRADGVWTEHQKLTASDAALGDGFGFSVAISGDTLVVGARDDQDANEGSGSAYVFVRTEGVWAEQQKLTAADAGGRDLFGSSVAVAGETVAVGARGDDHAGGLDAGSAYVFTRADGVWTEQQKLTASDAAAGDGFGFSVAISGNTVVVGAFVDDHVGGTDAGSAYAFTRDGTVWTQQAKLSTSDAAADDRFGVSAALAEDTVMVGAYTDDHAGGLDAGSAYVFDLDDYDADAVSNLDDICPYTWGGCPVDVSGRPLFDLNDDCIVSGLDIQIVVDEIMVGAGWDIVAAVDDLLSTCSPCE